MFFCYDMVCLPSLVSGAAIAVSENSLNKVKHWGCPPGLTKDLDRGSLSGNFARN